MSFTAGPWEHRKAGEVMQVLENGTEVPYTYPNHVVARSKDNENRRHTSFVCQCNAITLDNEANARLIAAAPDLLDALKALIEGKVHWAAGAVHPSGLFCTHCGLNSEQAIHSPRCHVFLAEKAIAKAEATDQPALVAGAQPLRSPGER